jgi:dTDP-4-dehydrorhamnose reductase
MSSVFPILVNGAGGFVAGSVIVQAGPEVHIHAVSRREVGHAQANLTWHQMDITQSEAVLALMHHVKPRAVIHLAAIANIDYAEQHPEEAQRINTDMATQWAEAAARVGAKFIFASTDNVFDGDKGDYRESDPPHPANFYGRTKVMAEQGVLASDSRAVIARIAWVLGFPLIGEGNSFLARMVKTLRAGGTLPVAVNEIRSPVDVITLGRALLELAQNEYTGILHLSGSTYLTRYDMARYLAQRLGFDPDAITPMDSNAEPERAYRPRDISLNNSLACSLLHNKMVTLEEGVNRIMEFGGFAKNH